MPNLIDEAPERFANLVSEPGGRAWIARDGAACQISNLTGSKDYCTYTYTGDVNSVSFRISDGPWSVCFDPDDTTTGASTATGKLWQSKGTTNVDEKAFVVENTTLDGNEVTEKACIYYIGQGTYWWESVTSPGGDTAVVTIERMWKNADK